MCWQLIALKGNIVWRLLVSWWWITSTHFVPLSLAIEIHSNVVAKKGQYTSCKKMGHKIIKKKKLKMVCGFDLSCKAISIIFCCLFFGSVWKPQQYGGRWALNHWWCSTYFHASCLWQDEATCGCYLNDASLAPIQRGAAPSSSTRILFIVFIRIFYDPCCLHNAGPGCCQLLSFAFQRLIVVVTAAVDDWHSHRVFAFIVRQKPWPGGQMVVMGGVHTISWRWNDRFHHTPDSCNVLGLFTM